MFSLDNLNKYIKEFDGNKSTIMGLLEDRIIEFTKDPKSGFHEDEYYMLYEFCLFDDDYFRIKKDMLENNTKLDVVDIGCQFGFQSEIFLDRNYTGLECSHDFFFNQDLDNVNYITGLFPYKNLDLSNKVVISNMSLGFFNCYLTDNTYAEEDKITTTDLILIDELSKAKVLYCNSRPIFIEELKKRFDDWKFLDRPFNDSKVSTGVYKFY